jgi:hypothetical protein
MNTAPRSLSRDGKLHSTAVVSVSTFRNRPVGTRGLEFWLWLERLRIDRGGVRPVVEKTFRFDNEDMICIGGDELNAIMGDQKGFPGTAVVSQLHVDSRSRYHVCWRASGPSDSLYLGVANSQTPVSGESLLRSNDWTCNATLGQFRAELPKRCGRIWSLVTPGIRGRRAGRRGRGRGRPSRDWGSRCRGLCVRGRGLLFSG